MMLARQSAPLPRQFCKVSACFIFNSQCGHALTVLRPFKVILNFRAHAARLVRSRSQASSTSTISPIFQSRDVTPAAIVTEAGPGLQCEQAQGRHYQERQAEWGQGLRTVRKYWELTNSPPRSLLTENKVCQMTSPTGVRRIGAESVFLSPMKFSTGPTNSMYQRNGFRKQ